MKNCKSCVAIYGLLLLASCTARLPQSLRQEIASENDRLGDARKQLQRSETRVHDDLAKAPDLFRDAAAPAEWEGSLRSAREKLNAAERDGKEMDELARRNRADSRPRVEQLLGEERDLRLTAVQSSETVERAADKWIDVQQNASDYLPKLNREHDEIRAFDLEPVSAMVHQAEQDWPAKRTDLDARLAALQQIPKTVETQWSATEATRRDASEGKLSGADVATLIREDDEISTDAHDLPHKADELRDLSHQLYNAWDKILIDLDVSPSDHRPDYREEIKTVRTHFIDVPAKKTEISSDEQWVDISEPSFHALENDIGMSIAHKDAGLYDSEAQTTPQPAGFAYIAPPSQGSNQYGYWTHTGGESFWTFLPEYLLLRQLMWGHDYRPVVVGEYNGYRMAERSGRSYYGQETPASPPKYGTHGTFTQTHYAQSRYVQSGGFKSSAYASHGAAGPASGLSGSRFGQSSGNSAGRRFGSPPGSQGKQFGAFRTPGRRFGRRR
ncbi:MAG: hypothetical protein WB992_11440 [Bryobacteraceae bacterium]